MSALQETLSHVKSVLDQNRRTEYFLLIGIAILFVLGVVSAGMMLYNGAYIWSIPSAAGALFLKWPIERVERMRRNSIALSAAPIFISQLPPAAAAKEIQKLLESLFKEQR